MNGGGGVPQIWYKLWVNAVCVCDSAFSSVVTENAMHKLQRFSFPLVMGLLLERVKLCSSSKLFGLCFSFSMIIGAGNRKHCWYSLPKSVETVSYPKSTESEIK